MTTRVEKIIQRSRDILADESADRWSNEKLLRWLDEAYEFCVMDKKLLRDTLTLPILSDSKRLVLPDEVFTPTRVVYRGKKLPLYSHEYMDEQHEKQNSAVSWEETIGTTLKALIFDRQNIRNLKFYPILVDQESDITYTEDDGITDQIDSVYTTEMYGIVSNITFTDSDNAVFNSVYGVIDSISDADEIKIYYNKKNSEITSITDELEVDDVYFDTAMKYYIVALALTSDTDAMNNRMSDKYFALSAEFLDKVADHSSDDFIQSEHNMQYIGFT